MNAPFDPKVIVALDFADARSALDLAGRLDPAQCRLKIGKELFTAAGPALVGALAERGFPVFLDLKFHDIPNTVASACRAATKLGVWMLNIHAFGGKAMMDAARDAIPPAQGAPRLIAVTLLTSMSQADLTDIGVVGAPDDVVLRLAALAQACGLDGVVCSAQEARALREHSGAEFMLVTPGIRPADAVADDQQRVMTAADAIAAGASYIVVGRPITCAADPLAALERFNREIAGAATP